MKVKLIGWREGIQKIAFVKLQVDYFQISLREAKTNVDRLLEGETIELVVPSEEKGQGFIQEAKQMGVICEFEYTINKAVKFK